MGALKWSVCQLYPEEVLEEVQQVPTDRINAGVGGVPKAGGPGLRGGAS